MTIHYFELDPETGIYKAGCKDESGKRFVSSVWATGGRSYVRTGSRRDDTLRIYWLTQEQDNALTAFMRSNRYSIEYKEGIA